MQRCLGDQRSQAINVGFLPWPLGAEISLNSVNLLMILWIVDDEICKFPEIMHQEMKLLDYLPTQIFTNWWASLHPWLWTTKPFQSRYCYVICDICYQLTCLPVECSRQVFFEHSTVFPIFCCSCPNFFGMCCWHQPDIWHVFQIKNKKTIKLISLNIKYLVFLLYSVRSKMVCKSLYPFFHLFYTVSVFFDFVVKGREFT